jgi:chromosomal replication initiation ATPase DnaA
MDKELVELIKNQVINELKKDYFLVKKSGDMEFTQNVINSVRQKTIVMSVIDLACDIFKIKKEIIISGIRKKEYLDIRYIIYIVCRESFRYPISLSLIGEVIKKHHASVLHGYNKGLNNSKFDKQFAQDLEKLRDAVKSKLSSVIK